MARRAELIKKGMVTYKTKQKKKRFYDLWGTKGDDQIRRLTHRLETPKMPLPGRAVVYLAAGLFYFVFVFECVWVFLSSLPSCKPHRTAKLAAC